MEMPNMKPKAKPKEKPKAQAKDPPAEERRTTRKSNKFAHPAVAAGLAKLVPTHRRTQAEIEAARSEEAEAQEVEAAEQLAALAKLTAIEDEHRTTDIIRAKTANHPVDPQSPKTDQPATPQECPPEEQGEDADDESDEFVPAAEPSEDDEDDGEEGEEEEDVQKPKKAFKPSRADVVASRSTKDASGTPATSAAGRKRKAEEPEKKNKSKKAKTASKKKSGLAKATIASDPSSDVPEDDEKAVRYGGPAIDNDKEELERNAQSMKKKKKGMPAAETLIKIALTPQRQLTKKQIRDNANKWSRLHLPDGTYPRFVDEVVPLARELLGTVDPWAALNVKQVQSIVDRVYGANVHAVDVNGPWFGLLNYRLTDWRAGIAAQGIKAVQLLVDAYEPDSEDEAEPEPAKEASTDPLPMPVKFRFDTAEGVAQFVEWALQMHPQSGTRAFHWQMWGGGKDKKGLFQSQLIQYTFAYHLMTLNSIPAMHTRSAAQPIGALLLSVQAVERALQFRKTGELVVPKGVAGHFSIDNWGDQKYRDNGKTKTTRRATKFVATLQAWDEKRWQEIRAGAEEWVEKKKRAASSRASSDAGDLGLGDEDGEDDEQIMIIVSD
ncbi:hypothetical protein C8J57DRAFT_14040 [Mycena rebaudengoi]|nr:hypothetical protein C8J57DRAFT_14040 [Mycena rebaudengoi]